MEEESNLVNSPLCQSISIDNKTVEVHIYQFEEDNDWALEVVDEYGNSTVWDGDDAFKTDQEAFDEVTKTIKEDGISSLIGTRSIH